MIYIDLLADLNLEDDQGRNVARLAEAIAPNAVTPGAVLVAGAPRAWTWAVVESVDSGFVYFRPAKPPPSAQLRRSPAANTQVSSPPEHARPDRGRS